MLSKTAIHTVSALACLAERPLGTCVGAGELAREVGAPQNYLGKLLKGLADQGLVVSQKGKGGGFRLARKPHRIALFDIVDSIDHVARWNGCFLGRPRCADDDPCPVHCRWGNLRNEYLRFLRETTLADLRRGENWQAHCARSTATSLRCASRSGW